MHIIISLPLTISIVTIRLKLPKNTENTKSSDRFLTAHLSEAHGYTLYKALLLFGESILIEFTTGWLVRSYNLYDEL